MRRGGSLSEILRTRLNDSTLQRQMGYALNSLPSLFKESGPTSQPESRIDGVR